jgi:multiple sugar transport system substrate-binding protein
MMFRAYCQKMKSPGFLCLVALSLLLFNISCNNVAITPEPEPVEISFSFVLANDRTNDVAYYESLVAQFNARYPYITVDVDPVNRDPLLQYSEADVFLLDSDEYRDFKERGSILALDSFIEQDESFDPTDFFPGAMHTVSDEGQTWAIPAGVDPFVMFYNKDLFDQNGVDYPDFEWTWDDFLNAAIAISDPDAGIYGYGPAEFGLSSGNSDSWFFVYQHGEEFQMIFKIQPG